MRSTNLQPKDIRLNDEIIEDLKQNPIERYGEVYHPIPFKEFSDLKISADIKSAYRKLNLVLGIYGKNGNFENARLLDIGANAGLYAYEFAMRGAQVDAVEPDKRYFEIGRKISWNYDLPVHWLDKPISLEFLHGKKYDVCLMLSVFQWITNGNTRLEDGKLILGRLSECADVLFFELGCNSGKSPINIPPNIHPYLWIKELLQQNTAYHHIRLLGVTKPWGRYSTRYLFVCSKKSLNCNMQVIFFSYFYDASLLLYSLLKKIFP